MIDMEHVERLAAAAKHAAEMAADVYDAVKAEAKKIEVELGGYVHQEYPKWVEGKLVHEPKPEPASDHAMDPAAMGEAADMTGQSTELDAPQHDHETL